jgi:hypothetical protein
VLRSLLGGVIADGVRHGQQLQAIMREPMPALPPVYVAQRQPGEVAA